jgi:hypothetical protein
VSYPERFPIFGAQYFPYSLSMSNHNSQLTLHIYSHASGISALRREGRKILRAKLKILRAKYRKPFVLGHIHINFFSQNDRYYDLLFLLGHSVY